MEKNPILSKNKRGVLKHPVLSYFLFYFFIFNYFFLRFVLFFLLIFYQYFLFDDSYLTSNSSKGKIHQKHNYTIQNIKTHPKHNLMIPTPKTPAGPTDPPTPPGQP